MCKKLTVIFATIILIVSILCVWHGCIPREISVTYIYDENYRVNLYPKSDYDDPEQYDCVLLTLNMLMRIKETPWDIFHEDVIKDSTGGCVAELLSYSEIDKNGYWQFRLKESVYGDVPENEFTVIHSLRTSYDTMFEYEVGEEYFVAFDHSYSELFDTERYSVIGGVNICLSKLDESKWYRGYIEFSHGARKIDIINYFKEFAETYGYKLKNE